MNISSLSVLSSLRWRVVFWITAVVMAIMTVVIVLARSVLLSDLNESANRAVEQEIEEFRTFATQGIDPATSEPFQSADRMVEVYLSRQIPDSSEVFFGIKNGELIQLDLSGLGGGHPAPLRTEEAIVEEISTASAPSGIFEDRDRGRVHWGKVDLFEEETGHTTQFIALYLTHDAAARVDSQIRSLSLIGVGGVALSILIGWIIAAQIVAPIRRLKSVASTISNSDLTRRVPIVGEDEIAELSATFNSMLDRLETAYNDQRQFVDDAGHELRTPITVVRGQLELLNSSPPEQRARSIELATTELDRMSRMVNDLLTLAVADSGDFLHVRDVDVEELMVDIIDKAETISDRTQPGEIAEGKLLVDEERITEAILELFSNALRYSDGPVSIGSTLDEGLFRVWVRDHGPGVSEEQQRTLFHRFHKGAHSTGGAGLGLSIVQAIGAAHGGRAYVHSGEGLGAIFGLEIPVRYIQPADTQGEENP